jgi:hypothetical protein
MNNVYNAKYLKKLANNLLEKIYHCSYWCDMQSPVMLSLSQITFSHGIV